MTADHRRAVEQLFRTQGRGVANYVFARVGAGDERTEVFVYGGKEHPLTFPDGLGEVEEEIQHRPSRREFQHGGSRLRCQGTRSAARSRKSRRDGRE